MADIAQYQFSFKELAEILIKAQDIHEGSWSVGFNLNMGAGLMGATGDQAFPGAMVQITSVNLMRVEPGQPLPPAAVDAAAINPRTVPDNGQKPARGVKRRML